MSLQTTIGMIPRVQVSYFDPFHVFDGLRNEIEQRLPLTNLHWKSKGGALKTISSLNVKFISSTGEENSDDLVLKPFINCVVISCESVEEYRSKIRPLIKNWLPSQGDLYCANIVVLHSNKEVLDSNIFKSVSLIEKFNKDFPSLKTLETKTVYRSNDERETFWNGLINKLKHYLLEVFENRIESYSSALQREISPSKAVVLHENSLKMYLSFQLIEEASTEISRLDELLNNHETFLLIAGDLRTPLFNQEEFAINSISTLISKDKITYFGVQKCILQAELELYMVSSNANNSERKLNAAFHKFLSRLHVSFHSDKRWLQFKYSAYDEFINLTTFDDIKSDTWKLVLCDMKNEQRECWIQLACSRMGYKIPLKDFRKEVTPEVNPSMEESFRTLGVFYENIIQKTKDLLKEYSSFTSKRQRVMDWLSIEIAFLYFEQGDYSNCMLILQSSYDFYMESGWSVIGSWLLEYYIECIKNCPNITEIDVDGDLVPKSIVLSNSYLNLLTSNSKNPRKWWIEFLNNNIENNDNLIYPLDNLFLVEITRKVFPVKPNSYGIDISFSKNFKLDDINISSITLLMKNYEDEFLPFKIADVILNNDNCIYTLISNSVLWSTFELVALEVVIGSTVFKKEFDSFETEDSLKLQPCQSFDAFKVTIEKSIEHICGKTYLRLKFENKEDIDEFTFSIHSTDQDDICFEGNDSSVTVASFGTFRVPFERKSALTTSFFIKTVLSFSKGNEQYIEKSVHEIDYNLPLDVSVDDVYLNDRLVFDFSLKSFANEAILIFGTGLETENTETYSISEAESFAEPVLMNPAVKTPYHVYFQILNKQGLFSPVDKFRFSVKYLRVQQYFGELVQKIIPPKEQNIVDYNYWQNYIVPNLKFSDKAFESSRKVAIILEEPNILESLELIGSSAFKVQIKSILKKLKSGIPIDELPQFKTASMLHELVLPVNIPTLSLFYSVHFRQIDTNKELKAGVPSSFKIEITNLSGTWDLQESQENAILTIANNSDWIIGGKRRFELDTKRIDATVNLIPLRRGYLNYPSIELTGLNGERTGQMDYLASNDKLLIF